MDKRDAVGAAFSSFLRAAATAATMAGTLLLPWKLQVRRDRIEASAWEPQACDRLGQLHPNSPREILMLSYFLDF